MSKYSFRSLFEAPIDLDKEEKVTIEKVVIPRIQRDYAQGRKERKGEIECLNDQGRRFIDNIFDHLKEGTPMEMDFIYGATDRGKFLPLDGQQRLTTLYLLYWYIGSKELEEKADLYTLLKKFSYETRASARQFCEKLSSGIELDFDEHSISKQVRDFPWYSKMYDRDPTVIAMMNMLDEIHERYRELEQPCYKHLELLTFSLLSLNRFHLTDELYIKMNARGKQLTDFENFKADLTNWMTKCEGLSATQSYRKMSIPHHMVFLNKLDNEWTDTLWKLSKRISNRPAVDELFLSLFYRWFLFEYIFESETINKEINKDFIFKHFEAERGYADLKSFEPLLTEERVKRLEYTLDLFTTNIEDILETTSPSWTDATPAYFLFEKKISQPQRMVLYGVWAYLDTNKKFEKEKFRQWMRVVWNIVENTDIDNWRSAIGVLVLLHKLVQYSDDIYEKYPDDIYAKYPELKTRSTAIYEERRKVLFIRDVDASWESLFIEAEKHPFLKGEIGFMIEEGMNCREFKQRTEMARKVFDKKGVSATYRKGHLLLRAIISRYSSFDQLKNRNYTDTDEKEHYLKKMLASDEVVKSALLSWLSLESEEVLHEELEKAVAIPSRMQNTSSDFERKMHEDLYKESELQNWMQAYKAIRFALNNSSGSYFVSRPNSWHDWVMLDSYRDEMINTLVNKYNLNQPPHIKKGTTKYHIDKRIELLRVMKFQNQEVTFVYSFDEKGTIRVGIRARLKENNNCIHQLKSEFFDENDKAKGWICRKKYSYKEVTSPDDVGIFLQKIEEDVFDQNNSSSLASQIGRLIGS